MEQDTRIKRKERKKTQFIKIISKYEEIIEQSIPKKIIRKSPMGSLMFCKK